MRIPGAVALFKQALPLVFPGLTIGNDLSNRTSIVSASASWTIWYDPATGKNRRSSAADALLWAPSQQRRGLTVLATHKVDKVMFDAHMKATGVVFVRNSNDTGNSSVAGPFKVFAAKEVILSAGTLASSPVLERSGIGRDVVLKAAGVKQLLDLPGVGSNLNVCGARFHIAVMNLHLVILIFSRINQERLSQP
jgi:choline dehydrogenase